jgi:two-component system sensor histidine kinase ChiS
MYLITDSIISSIKDKNLYKYRYIGTILLRGKTSPVKIYEIYNHYPDILKEQYEITKEKFYEGITLFTKNKIENALEIFDQIIEKNPYDNPARYYQFKCRSIIGF